MTSVPPPSFLPPPALLATGPSGPFAFLDLQQGLQVIQDGLTARQPVAPLWGNFIDLHQAAAASSLAHLVSESVIPPEEERTHERLVEAVVKIQERMAGGVSLPASAAVVPPDTSLITGWKRRPASPLPIGSVAPWVEGLGPPGANQSYFSPLQEIPDGCESLWGDKASRLARLRRLGYRVPSGGCLSSRWIDRLLKSDDPKRILAPILPPIVARIENEIKCAADEARLISYPVFGDSLNPLLLVVRSGAERVIEGLLPTILSVGLNDRTVFGLARTYRDTVGAFELYLKFVCDYGKLVHHLDPKLFSRISPSSYARKRAEKVRGHVKDILKGLSVPRVQRKGAINRIVKLKAKIEEAKDIIKKVSKQEFPEDPLQQLEQVTVEVAKAWEREDVVRYRKYHGMSESPPAAVLIQEQANGKLGTNSGVAVVFSRDPATGEPGPVGWAKWKATGDEVMSGPAAPISERDAVPGKVSLERLLFRLARSEAAVIKRIISDVEHIYRQPMKIEIVIDDGRVVLVQAAKAQMTPFGMVRSLVDRAKDTNLSEEERLTPTEMRELTAGGNIWDSLNTPQYERPSNQGEFLLSGESEFPGAVVGPLIFDFRQTLQEASKRRFIYVLDGSLEPHEAEAILRHALGIVVRGDPGIHFLQRAIDEKVPLIVVSNDRLVSPRLRSLPEGTNVILDSTREEGFLTDKRDLPMQEGDVTGFVRRLLEGNVDSIDMTRFIKEAGRRDGERIGYIRDFYRLVPPSFTTAEFIECTLREGIEETVERLGLYPSHIPNLHPIRVLMERQHWIIEDDENPFQETFNQEGRNFVRLFFQRYPRKFTGHILSTSVAEHSLAMEVFRSLLPADRAALMNRMVDYALMEGMVPGWECGVFLISRFLAAIVMEASEPKGDPDRLESEAVALILEEIKPETILFILKELFVFDLVVRDSQDDFDERLRPLLDRYIFQNSSRIQRIEQVAREGGEKEYLLARRRRHSGVDPQQWVPFLEQPPFHRLTRMLESSGLSEGLKIWIFEVLEKFPPVGKT